MSKDNFNTPILFLIFNRLDNSMEVFNQIKKIKPNFLYIAADGPRKERPEDKSMCDEVRNRILSGIDWDCKVKTLFRDENLGCGIAVSTAITWFFEQEELGIILEDDTVPDLTFFNYCSELLEHYKNDLEVMLISGNQFSKNKLKESYNFTRLPFVWGWATWRRAWKYYDYNYRYASESDKEEILTNTFSNAAIKEYWLNELKGLPSTHLSFTWDYQWFLTVWKNNGLVIQPQINLVKNVGYNELATHTTDLNSHLKDLKTRSLSKINHLSFKNVDESIQNENFQFFYKYHKKRNIFFRNVKKATNLLKKIRKRIAGN